MSDENSLSDAEHQVLNVLWDDGPSSVRQIRQAIEATGRSWAPTTVNTLLTRLEKKGFVEVDKSEFAHVFRPKITREVLVQQRLQQLADAFCDGSKTPLMLALAETQKFSDQEVAEFRQLLDRLENKNKTQAARRKRKQK